MAHSWATPDQCGGPWGGAGHPSFWIYWFQHHPTPVPWFSLFDGFWGLHGENAYRPGEGASTSATGYWSWCGPTSYQERIEFVWKTNLVYDIQKNMIKRYQFLGVLYKLAFRQTFFGVSPSQSFNWLKKMVRFEIGWNHLDVPSRNIFLFGLFFGWPFATFLSHT